MSGESTIPPEYWSTIEVNAKDLENLHSYLFERETPLTTQDLVAAFVEARIGSERASVEQKRTANGKTYLPKDQFQVGEKLVLPALNWAHGVVKSVRAGVNAAVGSFDVITVELDDHSERLFAANHAAHRLNQSTPEPVRSDDSKLTGILQEYGDAIKTKIESALASDKSLVKIAGRWFPRSLLVDVKEGQLNLAEAVLDVAAGEPRPTADLLKDVELQAGVNPKLAEFSLNYALQDDERFDEVGPAGQVLWCLRRLEPESVREVPLQLRYEPIEHDRALLDDAMRALESQLDDELTPQDATGLHGDIAVHNITLIYPHLRAGTLPMSPRARKLFPTAYESPRVRFTLVDGKTKQRMPAWVERPHGYVFGLREWYKAHQLIPGSLVQIRRGDRPDEVIVDARSQRSSKDWVRTVMVGNDGGLVFAMLKQQITAEFNDRMTIHVPDFKVLDPLWEKQRPFRDLVKLVLRELSKSNPQGHVHAQEMYAGVNLLRRVPPAPLFALLASDPAFSHVGDLHFRLAEVA